MKRLKSIVLFLLASAFALANNIANIDISGEDYVLYINDCVVSPGEQSTIYIRLKNATGITFWQTDLFLPEGMTVAKASTGAFDITKSNRIYKTHSVSSNELSRGGIRIACSSTSNKIIPDNDGIVVAIKVNVSQSVKAGSYTVALKNTLLVEPNEVSHKRYICEASIKVSSETFVAGDVDGDGKVTIQDVNAIADFLAGKQPAKFVLKSSDVDEDGNVSVNDLALIISMLKR